MIQFTSTKLASRGKKGILTPDEDGYYKLVVGGLNVFNSAKQYYVLEGAKQLFEQSSVFMRRVQNGAVKCEVGHPKRVSGMSEDDYFTRIMTIEETNVCAHIAEVWLDFKYADLNNISNGTDPVVAIWAKLKPVGPHGATLKAALDNPLENVFFSIRSFTQDFPHRGTTYRVLRNIVTFDWVGEAGIKSATKWDAPNLESMADISIPPSIITNYAQKQPTTISLENSISASEALELLKPLPNKTLNYLNW
jgi:hypothetical protein